MTLLACIADGMELPTGVIEKFANASIVLELAIRKIWLRMKAEKMPLSIVDSKKFRYKNTRLYVDETLVLQVNNLT